ncbi:MAG: DUF4363 family protein [Eubacteriales bacterium]|nr:DUF4363 family protein [Eubacteriales bacterium]
MTRSIIGLTVSIALIILLNWSVSAMVENTCEEMHAQIQRVQQAVDRADWEQAGIVLDETEVYWQGRRKLWETVIDHDEVEKVDILLNRLEQMADTRNYANFLPELQELHFVLNHVRARLASSWSNIL